MTDFVYVNGELVSAAEALISPADHGFLYGYGLFETMRAYNGVIFLLDEHLGRLHHGAAAIGLEERLKGIDLAAACRETIAANEYEDARVRLTITGGDAPGFPWDDPQDEPPTVVVQARPFAGYPPERVEQGYKACISSYHRCADSVLTGIKSVNYLNTVLARREAAALDLDESLLCNDDGFIAEGGNSNVFFVKRGVVVTPALGAGLLPGITRDLVFGLAQELDITCKDEEIRPENLREFEEAFFTSSVIEVMPLVSVRLQDGADVTFGDGRPGAVTRRLIAAYTARVARETSEK